MRVTCKGPCPKTLKRPYTKRGAKGSLSLVKLVRKPLRPGAKLTIVVSKPGWISATKTVQIRRGKAPLVN